ncbi:MAG: GAP family protein [Nocardiaceae bacterium]|nr:GAP family protein [Nocardiaceae bacterium]
MGNIVAQLVPVGIEMIVSPVPLAALIAILLSARAKSNAVAFTATAVVASAIVVGISALTAEEGAGRTDHAGHSGQIVFAAIFGLAFLALAAVSWRSRPRRGTVAAMPSWMAQIDTMNGAKAMVLSLLLTVPNAKNLPLELRAGALIANAHVPVGQSMLLVAGVAVLGGAGLIALSVLAAVPSKRVSAALGVVKDELVRHNAAIMTVLFLLLAGLEVSHLATALAA